MAHEQPPEWAKAAMLRMDRSREVIVPTATDAEVNAGASIIAAAAGAEYGTVIDARAEMLRSQDVSLAALERRDKAIAERDEAVGLLERYQNYVGLEPMPSGQRVIFRELHKTTSTFLSRLNEQEQAGAGN